MSKLLTKREKTSELKQRVVVLKSQLDGVKNWKPDFFKKNKKFDKVHWATFLNNMLAGQTTDENMVIALEKYVKSLNLAQK